MAEQDKPEPEMLDEYDFSGKKGIRGKYHRAYERGHTVKIHEKDGRVNTQKFTPEKVQIMEAEAGHINRPA
jgi:hypothetical protein